ncbi:NYN domain-containing protein [Bacillus norwichensis]|uniref:NYN domain-containing protein n=1 Tax=Bacillus norwichensis TaxID=2762217 RepID=A0ABR8VQV6_9BACI|nr:NYN domain-containing protein [Bacillus norwichensis]MBD8007137.1 NYN domain-containing protein [Bacillus norwichensis]
MNILIVDGYNMIGAWPELVQLKQKDLAEARDRLIEILAEYQGFTDFKVIVVFDAYDVKGIENKYTKHRVDVIYTKSEETADERIEKLANELNNRTTQIYVATSDFTEQWAIFGQGALRISARELLEEILDTERRIEKKVEKTQERAPLRRINLSQDMTEIFEKWRRGKK